MMVRTRLVESLLFVLFLSLFILVRTSYGAPCPLAVIGTVCAEVTEPTKTQAGLPLTNLLRTEFYFTKDGVALPTVSVPASAPTGGGIVSTTLPTSPCESDVYTVQALAVGGTIGNEKASPKIPVPALMVTKDRTGETPCLVPGVPTNPLLR